MFLKSLTISTPTKIIREISFHKGLNLIVDESEEQITGNNVGKTTVLRLIDFCLGGDAKDIYIDPENKKIVDTLVQDFLIKNKIIITLTLGKEAEGDGEDVVIKRNFLSKSKKEIVREINGEYIAKEDFENRLSELLLPDLQKELVHDNQLIKIAEVVTKSNIQFVASILKDKLPAELNKEEYFAVKLSQNDKLFRIENQS